MSSATLFSGSAEAGCTARFNQDKPSESNQTDVFRGLMGCTFSKGIKHDHGADRTVQGGIQGERDFLALLWIQFIDALRLGELDMRDQLLLLRRGGQLIEQRKMSGDTVVTRMVDRERIRGVGETNPIDLTSGLKRDLSFSLGVRIL